MASPLNTVSVAAPLVVPFVLVQAQSPHKHNPSTIPLTIRIFTGKPEKLIP
jgi:hypothetical protein